MGDFRIVIEGIGNHGCGRESTSRHASDNELHPTRCGRMNCVDCRVAEFVETLRRTTGSSVHVAKLEHWPVPGAAGTTRTEKPGPIDDLLKGTRDRSF